MLTVTDTEKTLTRRVDKRSLFKLVGYDVLQVIARMGCIFFFGVRCFGRQHVPKIGGGLVCSNHQSNLDPILVGLMPNRRMNYLARRTLYKFKPLIWLMDFLDAIPIEREGMGIAGIKETLRRLKRGELVAMYPEGTRTHDGEIGPFKPGFITLARRARVPLIPVGFDGAFAAWPRGQRMFKPTRISIVWGKPLLPEKYEGMTDDELLAELERRIRACFEFARRHRNRN